tara:strand:+ start:640 stop:1008 length:369 start_codon:yes stop_codon:yes gene_type:complete
MILKCLGNGNIKLKKCRKDQIFVQCRLIKKLLKKIGTKYLKKMSRKPSSLKKQVAGNHYKKLAIEPIEYILANNLSYCCGNAIKYISRDKGNRIDDLNKAIHYLEMEIELVHKKGEKHEEKR